MYLHRWSDRKALPTRGLERIALAEPFLGGGGKRILVQASFNQKCAQYHSLGLPITIGRGDAYTYYSSHAVVSTLGHACLFMGSMPICCLTSGHHSTS